MHTTYPVCYMNNGMHHAYDNAVQALHNAYLDDCMFSISVSPSAGMTLITL